MGRAAVALAAVLGLINAGGACKRCCHRATAPASGAPANEVVQNFPPSGTAQTAWKVHWAYGTHRALYVTGAWFKRSPADDWMLVFSEAGLADIFVPYHPGSPRYYDLSSFSFALAPVGAADAGCCGSLLGQPAVVVREVRDRGILWKDDAAVRRGQELVLWATLDAANYNYVIEYAFRDDGSVGFRLGATARNLPGMETVAHMHGGLWRLDIDLNGRPGDAVSITRHVETTGAASAVDTTTPFNGGVEGFADWHAPEFTQLRITDAQLQNGRNHPVGYDLIPMRSGTARHQEGWAHHDFWVSAYVAAQGSYSQVGTYVQNGEAVTNNDVVIWHFTPIHHLPRDEDGRAVGGVWQGVALLMWGGFELRPRNLFETTPLHP